MSQNVYFGLFLIVLFCKVLLMLIWSSIKLEI
jgi:hypothetical protein